MRTRNHFITGEGIRGFTEALGGYFPAGRLAVVCEDITEGQRLASDLLKKYKVELYFVKDLPEKKEDVRFVIGMGSEKVVKYARSFAGDVPFAFYAPYIDYLFLNQFDGEKRLAEFVYLDKNALRGAPAAAAAYASLFSLWCEGRIRCFETSYLPFKNKTLLGIADSAERVLLGECDREEFFPECLRLISVFCNALSEYPSLYVEHTAVLGRRPEERLLTSSFLVFLLINFTKIPFGAILNPSEEKRNRHLYDPALLPDEEKLKVFARRMKAMTELPETNVGDLMAALSTVNETTLPLLSALRERGLFEGWQNEKSTRDRGVPV